MPPVFFARFWTCDPVQGRMMNSRSGEPIPCYGEEIPCFAAEQGTASKLLGLLPEMTLRPGQKHRKGSKICKIPCSFPCIQGIRGGG